MGLILEFLAVFFAEFFIGVLWGAMPRWLRKAVLVALLACVVWAGWRAAGRTDDAGKGWAGRADLL